MNISLDYDGTYTEDPDLYLAFVQMALKRGHKVYVVTVRYPSECTAAMGFDFRLSALVPVLATSRMAKRPFVAQRGIEIHIWIDDNPQAVDADAVMIWGTIVPEGQPIVPVHGG